MGCGRRIWGGGRGVLDTRGRERSWDLIQSGRVGIEVGSGYRIGRWRGVDVTRKDREADNYARRCEEVAQLLEGKKGDELAATVRCLDRMRTITPDVQLQYPHRQSSSVPLPDHRCNDIALPALPFLRFCPWTKLEWCE